MKNNYVVILDFGSSKITCMAATKVAGKNDFVIRAVGQSTYNGFDDNAWYEPETVASCMSEALRQVEKKIDMPIKEVFVGVPGVFCATSISQASLNFHTKKKIDRDDVQEVIKKANIFDGNAEFSTMGGRAVYYILDGGMRTYDPIGSVATKLTTLVSFSFMKNYFREIVSRALVGYGIKKVTYLNTCDAEAQFVAQNMMTHSDCCFVIDVGHLTTNVMLSGGRSLLFARTFALGSGYLASDLCQVEGCDFPTAMNALRMVNLSLEFNDSDVYSVGGRAMEAKRTNEILKARIEQIADYVKRSFAICEMDIEVPRNMPIVLTGGGLTYIRGAANALSAGLNGKPVTIYKSENPQTNRNEYTSCYGLIAEAIKSNPNKGGFLSFWRR